MSSFSSNARSSVIKSIQRGTVTITGTATSGTATISAVDTSKSHLSMLGFTNSEPTTVTPNSLLARITLTNSTTVTANIPSLGSGIVVTASFEVVECY